MLRGDRRAVLDLTLGRRRGFALVEPLEVERLLRDVVHAAAKHLSDADLNNFLRDVEGLAEGADAGLARKRAYAPARAVAP